MTARKPGRCLRTGSSRVRPQSPAVAACSIYKLIGSEKRVMVNRIAGVATVVAAILAVIAFVTLSMERLVLSGTLFVLTSFAIYIRESYK